jgi:hypothetical protein
MALDRMKVNLLQYVSRIVMKPRDPAAMTGRSVVEHALIGSYLALYRGGAAAGLMKKQRGHARALHDYLFKGDMVAVTLDPPSLGVKGSRFNPAVPTWVRTRFGVTEPESECLV